MKWLQLSILFSIPIFAVATNSFDSVLVTGAAGFIGSHLARKLQTIGFKTVVGLDNFDAYYSPALKYDRAKTFLQHNGISIVNGDVCDSKLLERLFFQFKFSHVIHLAAQAGVRYSLVKPLSYIHANLECFTVLLEEIRSYGTKFGRHSMPHLLYASSSSVYGSNKKIPFTEYDPVEKPLNLYGATKRANELFAYSYYHLFGIKSIGFRLFTVYGPWGRPDMAAYLFTDKITRGEAITVYNKGNMRRDFTYVDDIVAGIVAALNYAHDEPMIFNLGNNKPVDTMYFLQLIEKSLGIKANIQYEESLAEIAVTYANTTLAQQELGFLAKTSIEEGIERFINWYKQRETSIIQCESSCAIGKMCATSPAWQSVAAKSRKLTEGCKYVVYTFVIREASNNHAVLLQPIEKFWIDANSSLSCSVAFISSPAAHRKKLAAASTSGSSTLNGNKTKRGAYFSKNRHNSSDNNNHHRLLRTTAAAADNGIEWIENWSRIDLDVVSGSTAAGTNSGSNKDNMSRQQLVKLLKMSPELFLASSVNYALYIDSKLRLKMHPESIVNSYMRYHSNTTTQNYYNRSNSKYNSLVDNYDSNNYNDTAVFLGIQQISSINLNNPSHYSNSKIIHRHRSNYNNSYQAQIGAYNDYKQRNHLDYSHTSFDPTLLLVHNIKHPAGHALRCKWYREYQDWNLLHPQQHMYDNMKLTGNYVLAAAKRAAELQIAAASLLNSRSNHNNPAATTSLGPVSSPADNTTFSTVATDTADADSWIPIATQLQKKQQQRLHDQVSYVRLLSAEVLYNSQILVNKQQQPLKSSLSLKRLPINKRRKDHRYLE